MTELYLLVLLSFGVTYIWRASGVAIAARIDPNGRIFEWIGCVAYAMLAGLMTRVLVFPVGVLDDSTLTTRLLAMGIGFLLFFVFKRSFLAGTLAAITVFYVLTATGY